MVSRFTCKNIPEDTRHQQVSLIKLIIYLYMIWFKADDIIRLKRTQRTMELIIAITWYGGLMSILLAGILTVINNFKDTAYENCNN